MGTIGVISKVSDPTPWCAGMVVVMKKSGANQSVLREVHQMLIRAISEEDAIPSLKA